MRRKVGFLAAVAAVVSADAAMRGASMRRFAFAVAAVAVLLLANSAAAAASGWSLQHIPNPRGADMNRLFGVSCASKSACIAVGFYSEGTKDLTLAERWNGHRWSIQRTPNPTSAHHSYLNGVSCTSASACTAVGTYKKGTANLTLAESWNGTKWSLQHTPNTRRATNNYLFAVSCASASECTAVGERNNSSLHPVALAERWNGAKWSILQTPNPTGAVGSYLDGISCPSKRLCTAVGTYTISTINGPINVPLAERWNGTKWSLQHTPNPAGAYTVLLGDSCASAAACTAVGYYEGSNGYSRTLAERWNGHKWQIVRTPNPAGSQDVLLYAVSCASARECTAVGTYDNGTTSVPLAQRWHARRWLTQHTPKPIGAQDMQLYGVSCASARACTAVGYDEKAHYVTLAERWTG